MSDDVCGRCGSTAFEYLFRPSTSTEFWLCPGCLTEFGDFMEADGAALDDFEEGDDGRTLDEYLADVGVDPETLTAGEKSNIAFSQIRELEDRVAALEESNDA